VAGKRSGFPFQYGHATESKQYAQAICGNLKGSQSETHSFSRPAPHNGFNHAKSRITSFDGFFYPWAFAAIHNVKYVWASVQRDGITGSLPGG